MNARSMEQAWQAVVRRDRRHDGAFVYAVSSTRIYCRPSCPARRPRRERVAFFETADEAERAGYRQCRRCRPRADGGAVIDVCVSAARAYLDAHLDEPVTLAALAARTGISRFHLQRAFKARVGLSPKDYVSARRLERFKAGVRGAGNVTDAIYGAGYGSSRGLYEGAKRTLGMTPAAYRRGGAGMQIRFAVLRCALGRLLVAVTELGVCAVLLGRTGAELERELGREFPQASCRRDQRGLEPTLRDVVKALDDGTAAASSLDLCGTDFQRRVWRALQAIPRGETRSYAELARSLGKPEAVRAVARACAKNRLAVLVPCHRAVRSDGTLAGYRWGIERKRRLLEAERGRR